MWRFECDVEYGSLKIQGHSEAITGINIGPTLGTGPTGSALALACLPAWASQSIGEIVRYLQDGEENLSDIPLDWSCVTPFEKETLQEARKIPLGETITYGELARRIHRPKSARAVGRALGNNPFLLAVPCHRIIGSDGALRGFSAEGGTELKAKLIQMEATGVTHQSEKSP
jgi:methylated-DNA-[protein]-cysteine S-methyltransferase